VQDLPYPPSHNFQSIPVSNTNQVLLPGHENTFNADARVGVDAPLNSVEYVLRPGHRDHITQGLGRVLAFPPLPRREQTAFFSGMVSSTAMILKVEE
jgi:hypothetical protein